ncbi:hypothetical protein [Streptomyces avidinii]|uniref:Uncharacterized protein n=1 Tax=Streptomyces avidinii TaxID=1895 RepID=A0ABS4L9L5_STRAV|nr:hypothetical protein [Streptomyces avidinii]MBP2038798.1 hypothetical protein [Streptomyces avidinii]GGZ11692.1 hypothetical protein GCM10010343_42930 [Streptomyces avidinii]
MPYGPTRTSTSPTARYGDPIYYPTAIQQPILLPTELPPGVEMVTLPGGYRTLAYTHPQPTEPAPAPAVQPIPAWAKTTALLAPTIGGGIAAAGFGMSYAAPGVLAMAEALWAAVALIAAGTLAPLLLRTGSSRAHRRGSVQHITQNITATGLFGKASGTLNNR